MAENVVGMFGITTETKDSNAVPLKMPFKDDKGNWNYPKVILTSVTADAKKETRKGVKPAIIFTFKSPNGNRQYTHIEWAFEMEDPKAKVKQEALNTRLKHMYTAFSEFPKGGIGTKAKNFEEFFDQIAKAFNEGGADKTPVYEEKGAAVLCWAKLIYNDNRQQFPYGPNFLERVREGVPQPTTLSIDLKYDVVEQTASTRGNNPIAGLGGAANAAVNADDLPSFDGE